MTYDIYDSTDNTQIYVCVCVNVCVYIYIYACMYVCVCIQYQVIFEEKTLAAKTTRKAFLRKEGFE